MTGNDTFEQVRTILSITGLTATFIFAMVLCLSWYYIPFGLGLGIGIESPDIEAGKRSIQVLGYAIWGLAYGLIAHMIVLMTEPLPEYLRRGS